MLPFFLLGRIENESVSQENKSIFSLHECFTLSRYSFSNRHVMYRFVFDFTFVLMSKLKVLKTQTQGHEDLREVMQVT